MNPAVVELNDEYKFFTLNAPDSSYEGIYTITVEVDLYNYANFNNLMQQSFEVFVMPSCNSTEFTTKQVSVGNFEDIGIRSGPFVKRVPLYSLTTE